MQTRLSQGFSFIERQRADLERLALALSDAQLVWKPSPDTWSVGQIVEHLVLSDETMGRPQDVNSVETEPLLFRLLPRALRRALILSALRRGTVLPVPTPDAEPRGQTPLPALLTRWAAARDAMGNALPLPTTRFSHPILGPLTPAQMLQLSQVHTEYHTRRISALQDDPAFPAKFHDE